MKIKDLKEIINNIDDNVEVKLIKLNLDNEEELINLMRTYDYVSVPMEEKELLEYAVSLDENTIILFN